jgi:hypothetical protein
VTALLLDVWVKNGIARIAAMTRTIAAVKSLDDASAGGSCFLDAPALGFVLLWLWCLARSCNHVLA